MSITLARNDPANAILDKDTLIECFAQNSSDEAIPVQVVCCIRYERECEYQRTDCGQRTFCGVRVGIMVNLTSSIRQP
jgi:hypothetical protein